MLACPKNPTEMLEGLQEWRQDNLPGLSTFSLRLALPAHPDPWENQVGKGESAFTKLLLQWSTRGKLGKDFWVAERRRKKGVSQPSNDERTQGLQEGASRQKKALSKVFTAFKIYAAWKHTGSYFVVVYSHHS